jgi:hypothetical protein
MEILIIFANELLFASIFLLDVFKLVPNDGRCTNRNT